ncbi:MAG TPA: hypothetical protein VJM74_03020 [Nitrososphaeraceae archaeon]|nr:hypothetical protein [Nitrososphaeraceae archaeon]
MTIQIGMTSKFQNPALLTFILSLVLALMTPTVNGTDAQKDFTIDAKINTQKLNGADKLKVVATANGDTQVKNVTSNDLKSKSATVSFRFNQKNNIVSVGKRDEYAVCAYALSVSNEMKSYSCVEGNIEQLNGKNTIVIGSGPVITLSSGPFKPVTGREISSPIINVHIPLSDRKDVKDLKVVAMIKGEPQSKTVDAQKMLKNSKDNTIIVPFRYDNVPEIGPIRVGDYFFACVSAEELNPPEGTECEHRLTDHTFHIHNIIAR